MQVKENNGASAVIIVGIILMAIGLFVYFNANGGIFPPSVEGTEAITVAHLSAKLANGTTTVIADTNTSKKYGTNFVQQSNIVVYLNKNLPPYTIDMMKVSPNIGELIRVDFLTKNHYGTVHFADTLRNGEVVVEGFYKQVITEGMRNRVRK